MNDTFPDCPAAPLEEPLSDVYEIVNPSDAYTIVGPREAVCAAVLLLGEGQYGVKGAHDEQVLPVYVFFRNGAAEADWRERFGRELSESLRALQPQIADALATVVIGNREDRARMDAVLACITTAEEREKARAAWHDRRRSSLNDIGARAAQMARGLRPPVPRSVL